MKRLLSAAFAAILVCAGSVFAADISNKFFSLALPDGWEEIKMPNNNTPGVNLMFANKKANCAVSVSCAETPAEAKDAAISTMNNMKKGGLKTGALEEKDGIYSYSVKRGPASGWAFYGSNGKELAIVTVWANKLDTAKAFFDNLRPVDPAIFPRFE